MPAGLRVRNASGDIIFDTTDVSFNLIGYFETGTSSGTHTITYTKRSEDEWQWFDVVRGAASDYNYPEISLSGSVFSWTFPTNSYESNTNLRVYYGLA